jgi:hypothetical protein
MTTDKQYTNKGLLENYLGGDITISNDDAVQFILATQKFIDKYTDRNFKADETASIRYFDGNDRPALIIDDCISVSKVEVGTNYYGDSFTEQTNAEGAILEYYLLPTNYVSEGRPIRKIGLRNRIWIKGVGNHRITAKWGYSENVPDDIIYAATVIASGMYYQNRGENSGAIKSEKIGDTYSVTYADGGGFDDLSKAMEILDSYKRILL